MSGIVCPRCRSAKKRTSKDAYEVWLGGGHMERAAPHFVCLRCGERWIYDGKNRQLRPHRAVILDGEEIADIVLAALHLRKPTALPTNSETTPAEPES